MNCQTYLQRIGVLHTQQDHATLCALQRAHYQSVPYENFDILHQKSLDLGLENLYDKIVVQKRGGYCFELNGLYCWLLRELGFTVQERLGRFLKGETEIPMGRHRILLVTIKNATYVCDVGIGGPAPTAPLLLQLHTVQTIDGTAYRFVQNNRLTNVLEYQHHGVWEPYFSFGNEENYPCDFIAPSFFCEKSPASIFNKAPIAHIFTSNGRISIDDKTLKMFVGDAVTVTTLKDEAALQAALSTHLGLTW